MKMSMRPDNVLTISYLDKRPADAARVLENFPYAMSAGLLEQLQPDKYMAAFQLLTPSYAAKLLAAMQEAKRMELANALPSEKLAQLCTFFDTQQKDDILGYLSADKRASVVRHTQYPPDTVGAIMGPPSFSMPNDITAAEALKRIKNSKKKYPPEIFILDRAQHYLGAIALQKLIKAPSHTRLGALLDPSLHAVSTRISLRSLAVDPAWTTSLVLPVVDSRGVFKGVIGYAALEQYGETEAVKRKTDARRSLSVLELVFQALAILLEGLMDQVFSPGQQIRKTDKFHDKNA